MVDSKLDCARIIKKVTRKAYSAHYFMFRSVCSDRPNILVKLYKTRILPHLEYCSALWNPTPKKLVVRLENIQKTFTRLLFFPEISQVMVNVGTIRLKIFTI